MMKSRLILAALSAACMVACTERIQNDTPVDDNGVEAPKAFTKTFSAIFSDGDKATRTELSQDNKVLFQAGDAISVFDVSVGEDTDSSTATNVRFDMEEGYPAPDGSAAFTGTLENEMSSYMAVYPYRDSHSLEVRIMNGNAIGYTVYADIPAVQVATPGSFDPAANVSVAKSQSTESGDVLYFNNLCALISFSIPAGESYAKIVFRGNQGETLAGTSVVSAGLGEGGFTFSGILNDGATSVALTGVIDGGSCYYIAVNPADLDKGFSIDMYDTADHKLCTKSSSKKVNLKRSVILNLGEISGGWLGSGTAVDPYQISSLPHLKKLAELFSTEDSAEKWKGKYFIQTEDIDCNGEYIRIGGIDEAYYNLNNPTDLFFEGNYDGNYHKISNFKLKGQDDLYGASQYYGLFAQARNSTFSNMFLEPASIYEDPVKPDYVGNVYYIGTLIACAGGGDGIEVNNCHVSSEDEIVIRPASVSARFGGLVGYCCEKIEMYSCSNDMDITVENDRGEVNGGGLIGVVSAPLTVLDDDVISVIDRCRNNGNITVENYNSANQSTAGGLVGMTFDTPSQDLTLRVSNCVNHGNIHAASENGYSYAAGIIAFQDSDGDWSISTGSIDPYIYNTLNTGDIYAEGGDGSLTSKTGTFAGGIAGYVYDDDTQFALCVNTGAVSISGDENIGAISASNGSCLWCYWLNEQSHTAGVSPALPCVVDGSAEQCNFYRSLSESTMNNRRTGSDGQGGDDIVLDDDNTQWEHYQWCAAGVWTGSATYGATGNTLDIDFEFRYN